jgi:hypothetical protein
MLDAMEREAKRHSEVRAMLSIVRAHIALIAEKGHEIALHVHPHWEDTHWANGRWRFENSRYRLSEFSSEDVLDIFRRYSACLQNVSGVAPTSYRAGGFCVEPFKDIARALEDIGITIDSSVVPGASLQDREKGFDFSSAPDSAYWEFDEFPSIPKTGGRFLQVPITPQKLPYLFYWGRLLERLGAVRKGEQFGDGTSKAIGKDEILRRLVFRSRVAELSIDDAKALHLMEARVTGIRRAVWHLMGHPKLVSTRAIETLRRFIEITKIDRFETVSSFAHRVR